MTHLETRLGVKLCQRGRSGFRLTEQGVAIHEATQRLLSAVENFCMDADVLKQHISGKLNLGIIDTTITDPDSPIPRTTQRFVSRGHDVHLTCTSAPPPNWKSACSTAVCTWPSGTSRCTCRGCCIRRCTRKRWGCIAAGASAVRQAGRR
jgi:hypothetical protein